MIDLLPRPSKGLFKIQKMKWFNKIVTYVKEARVELKKVIWPTRKEVVRHTLIVIGVSLATAVVLGIFDYAFFVLLERVI